MQIQIDDTNPEYTIIGGYEFPKGSTAKWQTDVFVIGKGGDLLPSEHWEFSVPGYTATIGVMDPDFDIAAKRIHEMLKSKGWIK